MSEAREGGVAVDPRLLDMVAAALCWAKFIRPEQQAIGPLEYWAMMEDQAKARYLADAERHALAMMQRGYVVVPKMPTEHHRRTPPPPRQEPQRAEAGERGRG